MELTLSYKVLNCEIAAYGMAAVEKAVRYKFAQDIAERVAEKIELQRTIVHVVDKVDFSLPPFEFSEQFGLEFKAVLVVMTPDELVEHDWDKCQQCNMEQEAYEVLVDDEIGANC